MKTYDYCPWCEECTDQFTREHVDCTQIICARCDRALDTLWKEEVVKDGPDADKP